MAVVWAQKKDEPCAKLSAVSTSQGTHGEKEKANYERSWP